MAELNRRLLKGQDIVYPITRQENVINLQKTIKEKMAIVSSQQPQQAIERQVWLDTSSNQQGGSQQSGGLTFGNANDHSELTFGEENQIGELAFGNNDHSQQSGDLTFGEPNEHEVLTFGNESENIEQQN